MTGREPTVLRKGKSQGFAGGKVTSGKSNRSTCGSVITAAANLMLKRMKYYDEKEYF